MLRLIVRDLLLPPGVNLLLALAGLLLLPRYRRTGILLLLLSLISLYLLSTAPLAILLHRPLEPEVLPLAAVDPEAAGVIVVLGAGRYANAPELGTDMAGALTLQRLHHAARLHHETGLPVLASGGSPAGETLSEAELMARVLEQTLAVRDVMREPDSHNTAQNAAYSTARIREMGVDRIYLVTHASHMTRSKRMFEQHGVRVIPAATVYASRLLGSVTGVRRFVPSMEALNWSRIALHEYIGLLYYRLIY